MRKGHWIVGASIAAMCAGTMAGARPACANESAVVAAKDKASARDLALRGVRAFRSGKADQALELLLQAQQLFDAPTHRLFIARAHAARGDFVAAYETYRPLATEPVAEGEPEAWIRARRSAQSELRDLVAKLHRVRLRVIGVSANNARVTIDGAATDTWRTVTALPAGEHMIEVSARGYVAAKKRINLDIPGQLRELEIELLPIAVPDDEPLLVEADAGYSSAAIAGATVSFGLAAAGIVVGAVTGSTAVERANELELRCNGEDCNAADEHLARESAQLGWVSTGAFIGAGVAAAVGITVLVVGGGESSADARYRPRLQVGLGQVQVGGTF